MLRHGWGFRCFSLVSFALFCGVFLLFDIGLVRNPTAISGPAVLFLGALFLFVALGAYLVAEAFRVRIEVTPAGVVCHSPWRKRRAIPWAEVASVSYSHSCNWLVITGQDGRKIRAHVFLSGLPWLARAVQTHLPPALYARDAATVEGLAKMAAGKPV
jgi:hypothetical protein